MQLDELITLLDKPKHQSDGSYLAICPSHADKNASLHISLKEGKILLKCFAGCTPESICQTLKLEMSDLFLEEKQPEKKIVATYTYKDIDGNELFQVVRFEPKGFSQRHKNEHGEYIWKMDGVPRVLYHLDEICLADTVYLVEGEKDADNLWSWGRAATTSPGGAQNWKPEYAQYLKGKKVIIVPDNDIPGLNYAKQVATSLEGIASLQTIILPPGIKDISDWLAAGNDSALLDDMAEDISVIFRDPNAPKIIQTITGYIFKWADFSATIRRVDVHKAGNVTGDITIEAGSVKLLPSTQFNFSAGRTRKELANDLATRDKTREWMPIIQYICDEVQTRARLGDTGQVIEANDDEVIPPAYLLEPLIMEGVPSVIYGDKGSKKTSLVLAAIGCISLGWADNPFGFAVDGRQHSVAFLDWESNWDLTRYNVLRLRRGMNFPFFKFAYRNCSRFPLADDLEAIQQFIDQHKVDTIVIDSLGAACGGDLFKPEPALKFFAALRQLPAPTSLIIAQNSKSEEGKKTIFGSAYFSYYSRNIFELKAEDNGRESEMSLGLFHKEGNYSKKYKPIGLHVTDTDQTMVFEPEELNAAEFSERIKQSLKIKDFLSRGAKSVTEIARFLDASDNSTRVLLTREKKKGHITALGSGMWGLSQQEIA